jgi:hypothetical protein
MTAESAQMKVTGRRVSASTPFRVLARAGLVARGVIYVIVGILAFQIAFGHGGKEADRQGALQTVAKTPGGTFLLWLLAAGLAGLALWRLSEAIYGQAGPDGHKATKRLHSLARAVFYAVVCSSTVAFVVGAGGPGSSNQKSKDVTGQVMHDVPGGRWLVLIVGLGFIAGGVGIAVWALTTKYERKLQPMSPRTDAVVRVLGIAGNSTRALIFAAAGVFLAYAGVAYDPGKAQGVDGTLRQFARTQAGPWLLVLVALGLVVFGAYSFCEARWRRI